jgi:hypothetical protein
MIRKDDTLSMVQCMENYRTHKPRYSDSSLYDEVCTVCGAKDYTIGCDELSDRPCPGPAHKLEETSMQLSDLPSKPQRLAVTDADITAIIYKEEFHVFGGRLTVCVLTLRNGFMVTGESCVVSAINFNEAKGRTMARENAREKIWPLEAYLLSEQIATR